MKDTLFPRLTHIKLTMLADKDIAKKYGYKGTFFACFGPGDDNAIGQIHLEGTHGAPIFRPPQIRLGNNKSYPVLKGKVEEELIWRAQEAFQMIRANYGKIEWGRTYRVAGTRVTRDEPKAQAKS
jgi:hypothetical protein